MNDPRPLPRLAVGVALALLALWVPLPFASVVPWAAAIADAACFALAAAALVLAARAETFRQLRLIVTALIMVALAGLVQTVPLPVAAVQALSPARVEVARQYATATATPLPAALPLSVAVPATRAAATRFAALAALLVAAAWVGRRRVPRRIVLGAVIAGGLFQVLYGGAHWMSGSSRIWDRAVFGSSDRLRGTFVNPDHTAVYLELALAVAFAWGWWAVRQARREVVLERRLLWVAPPALAWLALFAGLAFTASRAGLVAALAAALVQGALIAVVRRRGGLAVAGVLVVAVGVGVVAAIGVQQAFGRWFATSRYDLRWEERLRTYGATIDLWQRFPLTGTGLGTFRAAYPLAQPAGQYGTWPHAHNDYLEPLATGGVVTAALLVVALAAALARLSTRLRQPSRTEDRAAALAALGAVAALAVHSFFDFGLSMPAISATFVIIVGLALCIPPARQRPAPPAPAPADEPSAAGTEA